MNLLDDNIIIFILLIGLYYLFIFSIKKRVSINESENVYIEPHQKMILFNSNNFKSKMYNYVFKMDDKGLGYYLDKK